MLPRLLTVQNFLSYGPEPQTLDFREFDLACLVGPNGVGKSSIIEALTWCIWGKARSGTDNELVHLGAKAMNVTMELEANGETYRIIRKRSVRGKGGTSLLELQLLEGVDADAQFRSITTPSIKETQALINRTLGLSYETFVNSAYLRQGKADEFTTKRPAERKAILAEILGLTTYEALEARVRSELAQQDEEATSRTFFLEQLRKDVAELAIQEARLGELEATAGSARESLAAAEAELAAWKEKEREIALQRERADASQQESETLTNDLRELDAERERLQREHTATETLLADRERIEQEAAEAKKAQSALAHWNEKLEKAHTLEQERFALERRLAELRSARDARLTALQGQVELLTRDLAVMEADRARVQTVADPVQELADARLALATAEGALATAREQERAAQEDAEVAQVEGERVKENHVNLDGADATCPLCTQPLSAKHRAKVAAEYQASLDACRARYADAVACGKQSAATQVQLQGEIAGLRPRIVAYEKQLAAATTAQALFAQEEKKLAELTALMTELAAVRDAPLAEEEVSGAKELKTLGHKVQLLGYVAAEHAEVQQTAERTAPALERATALVTAAEHLETVRAQQTAILERMNLRRERLTTLTREREELARALEGEAIIRTAAADALARVDLTREETRTAEHAVVDLTAQVTALREKDARAKALESEIGTLGEQRSLLDELRQCFGRNGIPAMLIESAIPEIEERANEVLGRMSDYQFTIRLDVTREKRSGTGTVETLDIRIADSVGTRDYELYSGGEAFRINFAIRIALSHLLARRAGAQLRLLIIDEGFGTLDAIGRETLVNVLNAIRGEFEKVLVITHIQELKDAFSYQIRVEKRRDGSVLVRE